MFFWVELPDKRVEGWCVTHIARASRHSPVFAALVLHHYYTLWSSTASFSCASIQQLPIAIAAMLVGGRATAAAPGPPRNRELAAGSTQNATL